MQPTRKPVTIAVHSLIVASAVAGAAIALLVGLGRVPSDVLYESPAARTGPRPPIVSFYGPRSAITERQYMFITTREAFNKVWERHMGDRAVYFPAHGSGVIAPGIDFERYMVVAHFRGESANCNGELATFEVLDDRVQVRFSAMTFQTMASAPGERDLGERVTPFGIWVIPRSDKTIVFEENTQGLLGEDPVWTERRRFEGR